MEPYELWEEIAHYISNLNEIYTSAKNFENKIDRFRQIYKDNPEYFYIENLEKIFEENKDIVAKSRKTKKEKDQD